MEDLFTILKLYDLPFAEKLHLILEGQYHEYFIDDPDSMIREFAKNQKKKEEYRRINRKLKKLGLSTYK